jgi:drug/metabolite transporter (DMT)-like permease
MSIVAPIAATGVAVPVLVGVTGGDRPGLVQVAGIGAALVGIVLASREPATDEVPARVVRQSLVLALGAALGFGLFFVGVRASARTDALWSAFGARSASVVVLAAVAVCLPGRVVVRPASWGVLSVIGILDVGANALYALATRHGLLSVISVLSSLYPLATVLLARVVLGERVRRVQEVGVVAALAGVLLIASG